MDDKSWIDTSWFENICQKFEIMCLEVEEAVEEETHNMNRFCSDFMQNLLKSFDNDGKDPALSVTKDTNHIIEDHSKKELVSPLVDQSSVNEARSDLLSECRVDAINYENMEECVKEVVINDSYFPAKELGDGIVTHLIPSNDLIEAVELDVETIQPYHSEKLNESCIIVDRVGLSSVPNELRRPRSFKFSQIKLPEVFTSRKSIKKNRCDQQSKNCSIPSAITTKSMSVDEELCESDWEIVEISSPSTRE